MAIARSAYAILSLLPYLLLLLLLLLHFRRFPQVCGTASSSPHRFHHFSLFGQIHTYDEVNCRLRLYIELGDHVWLQTIDDKYYIVQLPGNNYSGLVGQASVLSCHEGDESMWREPFVVHGDIGAYRLDIILGDQNANPSNQWNYTEVPNLLRNVGDGLNINLYTHHIIHSHNMSSSKLV